jgi:peptidoglycan/LPS O-acetylase OafA/YrhL
MSLMAENGKTEYYPAFDYLRITLASIVALGHSGAHIWEQSGDYSVQVFFALSGWLIGGILLRSSPSDLPKFYFSRVARIWIPYLVAIILLMLASLLKERITLKWLEVFFYDLTFSYNFFGPPQLVEFKNAMPLQATGNHFWSICAEEQFYLCAPFLITIPTRIGRTIWFWCLISAAALASPYWGYFGSISFGVLASVVRLRLGDWHTTKPAIVILATVAALSFLGIYVDIVPYRFGAQVSAVSIVLLLAQAGGHSRVASFLGGVSFPMYLNHWIGTFAANAFFAKLGLRETIYSQIASVVLALVIGAILFLCIDRPVKAYRDEYFTVIRGKVVAIGGFALLTIGLVGGLFLSRPFVWPA